MSATLIDETAVLAKIAQLLTPVTNLKAIYQGVPPLQAQFPCVSVRPNSWDEEYGDTRDTVVSEQFLVTAFIQLTDDTLDAQEKLRAIVKSIREILGDQDNITLGGLIDSSRLISGQYLFDQKESSIHYCEMTYTVRKRFSRFA